MFLVFLPVSERLLVLGVCLLLAYGFYKLFLSGNTFQWGQNRGAPRYRGQSHYGFREPPPPGFKPAFTGSWCKTIVSGGVMCTFVPGECNTSFCQEALLSRFVSFRLLNEKGHQLCCFLLRSQPSRRLLDWSGSRRGDRISFRSSEVGKEAENGDHRPAFHLSLTFYVFSSRLFNSSQPSYYDYSHFPNNIRSPPGVPLSSGTRMASGNRTV